MSLEGWVPQVNDYTSLHEVVDFAFDYRGNTTVVKTDGSEVVGYIFNRNADVPEAFIQLFDEQGDGPFTIRYRDIATIKFTGKDTAAGNSWKAWVERKEKEKAVELEARALARALGLPRLKSLPFPAFGNDAFSVVPVGLRASLLSARLPVLLEMFGRPLVVSSGVCGALDPKVKRGTVVLPETVLDTRGERYGVTVVQHRRYVEAFERCGIPFAVGTLATAIEIVASPDAKAALRPWTWNHR